MQYFYFRLITGLLIFNFANSCKLIFNEIQTNVYQFDNKHSNDFIELKADHCGDPPNLSPYVLLSIQLHFPQKKSFVPIVVQYVSLEGQNMKAFSKGFDKYFTIGIQNKKTAFSFETQFYSLNFNWITEETYKERIQKESKNFAFILLKTDESTFSKDKVAEMVKMLSYAKINPRTRLQTRYKTVSYLDEAELIEFIMETVSDGFIFVGNEKEIVSNDFVTKLSEKLLKPVINHDIRSEKLLSVNLCENSLILASPTPGKENNCDGKIIAERISMHSENAKNNVDEEEDHECYFSIERIPPEETEERPKQSKVSTTCSEKELISFTELMNNKQDLYGTINEAQLILARGAAEFYDNDDWDNEEFRKKIGKRKICVSHRKEISTQWSNRIFNHILYRMKNGERKQVCSMPDGYTDHDHLKNPRPFITNSFHKVTYSEAKAFFEKHGVLIHIGIPVCREHANYLKRLVAQQVVKQQGYSITPFDNDFGNSPPHNSDNSQEDPDAFINGKTPPRSIPGATSSSSSSATDPQDPDFRNWESHIPLNPPAPTLPPEIVEVIKDVAKKAGISRIDPKQAFDEWQPDTIRKKVATFHQFNRVIAEFMAPGSADQLLCLANKEGKGTINKKTAKSINTIFEVAKAQYRNAKSNNERKEALAQIALGFTYADLLEHFPGLSDRAFSAARSVALRRINNKRDEPRKNIVVRYNKADITYFIEFITSPAISKMLPYGTQKTKLPDGTKYTIPPSMRMTRDAETINMFEQYKIQTGRTDIKMSHSVMRKILKVCAAKRKKSLHCVDYKIAAGDEAFEKLEESVEKMHMRGLIESEWSKSLKSRLKESQQFLKTDFNVHVKMCSRIADYCMTHALSDPTRKEFRAPTCTSLDPPNNHEHNLRLERVRLFDEVMADYRETLKTSIKESKKNKKLKGELEEMLEELEIYEAKIEEMKSHLLRTIYSERERKLIIENLPEGEAIITLDYLMKYLPQKHTETQRDFYSKKGLSWHISHIQARINGQLKVHSLVHLLNFEDQDGVAVVAIIRDLLEKTKSWNLRGVTLRSDQAGYYHSAQVIVSLPQLSKDVGIPIRRYSFSESQSGKGAADQEGSRLKRRIRDALDFGYDVTTAAEMYAAMQYGTKPLSSLSIVIAKIDKGKDVSKANIPEISLLSDFVYNSDNSFTVWRHHGIGPGKKYQQTKFKDSILQSKLVIEKQTEHFPDDLNYKFWRDTNSITNELSNDEAFANADVQEEEETFAANNDQEEVPVNPHALYSCPEPTCRAEFAKLGNLFQHLMNAAHNKVPEKKTMYETALNAFVDQLENICNEQYTPEVAEALHTAEEQQVDIVLPLGWALTKTRKNVRFSSEQVEFLDKQLKKHQNGQKRIDPKVIENLMREEIKPDGNKLFKPDQRLNAAQIKCKYLWETLMGFYCTKKSF